jgi:GNAT superfamily N-acetyltransferase
LIVKWVLGLDTPRFGVELSELRQLCWWPRVDDKLCQSRFSIDNFDKIGYHSTIRNDIGALIASSRLCLLNEKTLTPDRVSFTTVENKFRYPCAILNRSVVHPDYRRQGLWSHLIQLHYERASFLKAEEIWLDSSKERVDFLIGMGFEVISPSPDTEVPGDWWILRMKCKQIMQHAHNNSCLSWPHIG